MECVPRAEAKRNILFITVDQQRFDALGVNGGRIARTPVLDRLACEGLNYRRAYVPNVVCMPSRASMLTGQYPRTHGVIANGISLPDSAPNVARHLRMYGGYRTALIGKAHFDPHLDPLLRFPENRMGAVDSNGPWRGFEHAELATHGPIGGHHYARWLRRHHPSHTGGFGAVLTGARGGDSGAPEVAHNPIPRELYHTDWIADRTIAWLDSLDAADPFFCWVSFPDPHHPFDPPYAEVRARLDWRDLPLPDGHPKSALEAILRAKPRHWLDWYQGVYRNPEGGPIHFVPSELSDEQLKEVLGQIHVENELIDEACGRLFSWLESRGRLDATDIFYTSDHGDLQGDFGLLFKGPYHVDALMRVPMIWRPARSSGIAPAEIDVPVQHVDLAPTFCAAAGIEPPSEMQGNLLPTSRSEHRERALITFDSQFAKVGMHLRTIVRDGFICTRYEPSTDDRGGRFPFYWSIWGLRSRVPRYTGEEGELYDLSQDPHQYHNLWNDPARRGLRSDLIDDLSAHLPPERTLLEVDAPT